MNTMTVVYNQPTQEDISEKEDRVTLAKATTLLTKVMESKRISFTDKGLIPSMSEQIFEKE